MPMMLLVVFEGRIRMTEYTAKCRQCRKKVKDSKAIYVVATDEYFCTQKHLTENAKCES